MTLQEISTLEENWDGYGAIPVSERVIKNTQSILNRLYGHYPTLSPSTYGTISLDFEDEKEENFVYLEVGTTEIGMFTDFQDKENFEIDREKFDENKLPSLLIEALNKLKNLQ